MKIYEHVFTFYATYNHNFFAAGNESSLPRQCICTSQENINLFEDNNVELEHASVTKINDETAENELREDPERGATEMSPSVIPNSIEDPQVQLLSCAQR